MADDMDAFLKGSAEPEAVPETQPEPQAEAAPPDPKPEPAPDDSEGDEQQVAAEAEPADEAGIRRALIAERDKRRDWKEKAIRAEGEMAELRRQLEEAKKASAAPPPQQYQPPAQIDPATDPQGFVSRVQEVVLNERLNTSEMMARQQHGAEVIEAAITEFKEAAKADPSLFPKLYSNPHPYDWMVKEVERQRLLRDVGTDPAAYRAKLETELRAKLEAEIAERTQAPAQTSTAPRLAPSLATARSAAPRTAPAYSGPPPLDALFGS